MQRKLRCQLLHLITTTSTRWRAILDLHLREPRGARHQAAISSATRRYTDSARDARKIGIYYLELPLRRKNISRDNDVATETVHIQANLETMATANTDTSSVTIETKHTHYSFYNRVHTVEPFSLLQNTVYSGFFVWLFIGGSFHSIPVFLLHIY